MLNEILAQGCPLFSERYTKQKGKIVHDFDKYLSGCTTNLFEWLLLKFPGFSRNCYKLQISHNLGEKNRAVLIRASKAFGRYPDGSTS